MQSACEFTSDEIVQCGHGDIPFLVRLARETYPAFDTAAATRWLDKVLPNPDALILRTGSAAVVALSGSPPWQPSERQCHILFVLGAERAVWDCVRLLRATQQWARDGGCSLWRFGSDTPTDVGPLARRVGAVEDSPRYFRVLIRPT